jgi:4-hydroxybenzoate polyprenyltransferase
LSTPSPALLAPLIAALRPKQWLKNGLVLAALIFSKHALELVPVLRALAGALLFCAAASGLYLVNDIRDIEQDRAHPTKRLRPLASGALGIRAGALTAALLLGSSLPLGFLLAVPFGVVLLIYVVTTLGYCWGLKNVVILDVFVLASGFVLRAVAGAEVIDARPSEWLFICTLLLALFVALCKRRSEVMLLGEDKGKHRSVLDFYTPAFLDQMISAVAGAVIVCYSLYTMSDWTVNRVGSTNLLYSIPFVIFALFRYLYLVHLREQGGAPEHVFLTDKGMIMTIVGWVAVVVAVLYWA